jgi:hypothetical protein
MHTVTYAQTEPYTVNPAGGGSPAVRPWMEVTVGVGPGGPSYRLWCLVDTGADDVMMGLSVALILGIGYHQLPAVNVHTANGQVSYYQATGLTLDFAGQQTSSDVLFGPLSVPLLGRSALLALEVGFDRNDWHHT